MACFWPSLRGPPQHIHRKSGPCCTLTHAHAHTHLPVPQGRDTACPSQDRHGTSTAPGCEWLKEWNWASLGPGAWGVVLSRQSQGWLRLERSQAPSVSALGRPHPSKSSPSKAGGGWGLSSPGLTWGLVILEGVADEREKGHDGGVGLLGALQQVALLEVILLLLQLVSEEGDVLRSAVLAGLLHGLEHHRRTLWVSGGVRAHQKHRVLGSSFLISPANNSGLPLLCLSVLFLGQNWVRMKSLRQ